MGHLKDIGIGLISGLLLSFVLCIPSIDEILQKIKDTPSNATGAWFGQFTCNDARYPTGLRIIVTNGIISGRLARNEGSIENPNIIEFELEGEINGHDFYATANNKTANKNLKMSGKFGAHMRTVTGHWYSQQSDGTIEFIKKD